jgi:hypothetical protein
MENIPIACAWVLDEKMGVLLVGEVALYLKEIEQ